MPDSEHTSRQTLRPPRRRPNPLLLLAEAPRALLEGLALAPSAPLLLGAPRGDGHPVLVMPGFLAGDTSTHILRRYLESLGYAAHPWQLGRNLGPRENLRERLAARVDAIHREAGRKLSLVGWSLGGIYAREIAKRRPDLVRQVVTMGSPFARVGRETEAPRDVPCTSIFTRTDGIVHWRSCLEPEAEHTENIEVTGSHCGLGVNPLVLYAVADRLSQAEGAWRPFDRRGWRSILYGVGA